MGLLKHALIPFYAFLHLLGAYQALNPEGFVTFCGIPLEDGETQTTREVHLVGVILAAHVAMAYMCAMGFLMESAHFRGVVMVWEVIFYGIRTYNTYALGFEPSVYGKPGAAFAIAVVGAILHSMEPGLFTKDKDKTKTK